MLPIAMMVKACIGIAAVIEEVKMVPEYKQANLVPLGTVQACLVAGAP